MRRGWKSAALLLPAAVAFSLLAESDSLSCNRESGMCTVTHRKIYRSASQSFAVAELTGAELAEIPSRKPRKADDVPGVRVVILTTRGAIPLMNHATSIGVSEMEEEAYAIREFAADPQADELDVEHRNLGVALSAAAFALVIAGAILLANHGNGGRRSAERASP